MSDSQLALSTAGQQLALVQNDPSFKALVLALARAQVPDLRRERDDFEMLADSDFFDKLTSVACYLEALHSYRAGNDRFRVFTFGIIREALQRAMAQLLDRDNKSASSEINLDQWYFDALPDEIKFGPDPQPEQISMMTANQGNHTVDWIGKLSDFERRFPGLVSALYSATQRQLDLQDKMKDQFKVAMNYARGNEPMARLGRDILKAVRPAHPSSTSGGRILHY